MKKLFNLFAIAAIAVFTLAGCSKNDQNAPASDSETVHITVKANVQDLSGEPGTKTYIDDNKTIIWGTGEYMKIAVQGSSATVFANSSDDSADAFDGEPQATFEFSLTAPEGDSYKYMGLYPASAAVANNNTNPANYKVNLISTQNATASSYDPAAYIMVAQPEVKESTITEWMANYRRATALNKITLKNLSEDIKRVKITVPTEVYLAGGRHIDLTTGESGDIYNGGGRTNTVEIKYATPLAGGADMTIWFTSWDAEIPVGEKLTIVAYSNTHTFTREITVANKPITFKEGFLNLLSINMASAVEGDNEELEDGNYVILAKKNDNTYYALKAELTTGSQNIRLVSVDYNGSIDSYAGDANIIWTVSKSGNSYTISNDNKYLGFDNGSNNTAGWEEISEDWTTDNYLIDIAQQETIGQYYVTSHTSSSRYLSKNNSSDYFAFYANTQQYANIVFVPATVDSRTPVTLSFENETIAKTTANYSEFTGQTPTVSPNVSAITSNISYSMSGDAIGSISNGVVTLNGTVGTATVTASFEGDDNYRPATAAYRIIVTSSSAIGWIKANLEDITSSDVFVIVSQGYAMTNNNGTAAAPSTSPVTISGTILTSEVSDIIKWTVSGNATNGYTFYPYGNTTNWLYCNTTAASSSNNNIRVGTGDRKVFVLNDNDYLITKDNYTVRYLSIYNNSDWRGYANTDNNPAALEFYKYNDPRTEVTLSFSTPSYEFTINDSDYEDFTGQTVSINPSSLTGVLYEMSGASIGTINSSTGVITLDGSTTGTATVTASFDGNDQYKPASVSYTIKVKSASGSVPDPETITITGTSEQGCDNSSVTFEKNNGTTAPQWNSSDNGVRCYPNNTIAVVSNNYKISNLVITYKANKNKNNIYPESVTVNEGTFSTDYSTTGTEMIWSGSANEVVFTVNGTAGNVAIKSIVVTYTTN